MRAPQRAAVLSTFSSNEWDSKQDKTWIFGPGERHGDRARTNSHRETQRLSSLIENRPRHRKKRPSHFGPEEEIRNFGSIAGRKRMGTAPLLVDEDDCSPGPPPRRTDAPVKRSRLIRLLLEATSGQTQHAGRNPALDERPSRRIKRAATLASDSDVSSSGPTEKPRGLFGRAPLGSGGIVPAGPVPPIASVGERKPADGYFVGRGRYVSRSGLRETSAPDERPSRRIKRAATPASDSDVSRSGPREKPRGLFGRAPLGSGGIVPAGPIPPIASVGEGKPADGYSVDRGRYVSRSGLRETSRRTNARRGALNAPQLLPPIPTFPAPVHGKSRAAFLAAPRWAPVESFPPDRFRPLLRSGNGNPLTVISSVAGDMFPAPVCGKPRAERTPVAAH
jgi:hypothetical protein